MIAPYRPSSCLWGAAGFGITGDATNCNQEAQPKKHTWRPALVETKERKSLKRSPYHVENCTETRQSVYARTSYIIAMYIHYKSL